MSERADMDHPVTRRELREELANYPTKQELKQELADALANYPTRQELRDTLAGEFAPVHRVLHAIVERLDLLEHRITTETRAAMEWAAAQFHLVDDKYADLPARVAKLEARRARRR